MTAPNARIRWLDAEAMPLPPILAVPRRSKAHRSLQRAETPDATPAASQLSQLPCVVVQGPNFVLLVFLSLFICFVCFGVVFPHVSLCVRPSWPGRKPFDGLPPESSPHCRSVHTRGSMVGRRAVVGGEQRVLLTDDCLARRQDRCDWWLFRVLWRAILRCQCCFEMCTYPAMRTGHEAAAALLA